MTLPQGWAVATLNSIACGVNAIVDGPFGSNLKTSDYIDDTENGVPVLTTKNLEGDYSASSVRYISKEKFESLKRSQVVGGDILVAKIGSIGKTGIYPVSRPTAMIPANLLKFTVDPNVVKKYVFHFLNCGEFQKTLKGISSATAQPAFNITKFRDLLIRIPPLAEQHRIVAKIDALFSELDKGVEMLQTMRAQLRTYRQAVLKWAFEGREWEIKPLDKLGDLGRGKSKHRPRNDPRLFIDGKYPFVQTGAVKAANGRITEFDIMYGEFGLQQSKLWPVDTLCITIAANIADTAFLGIEACFPDSVVGFTANKELVRPKYVDFFIQSAKQMLWYYAPATAQKNINLNTLENLQVPYCTLSEQDVIIAAIESRLSVCDKLEQLVDENLAKAQALRQSILKKAFAGELVPQDPNDEPAEKLLERIKALKAAATKTTTARRTRR